MDKVYRFAATGVGAIVLGVLLAVGLGWRPAVAATQPTSNSNTGQALEIAPPVMTLTANPGQIIKTQISLRNISKGSLVVRSQVNDFTAAGEDGTPKILLDEGSNGIYSLKGWVRPMAELLMKPREMKTLQVSIAIPKDASPGGHYGIIRFTAVPPELKDTGVSLSASLGTLVLITVNGQTKEELSVQEFFVSKNGKKGNFFESTPLNFTERVKNSGNIHEKPAGQITIADMFGRKTATLNVNLPPNNILPQTIRKFEQPLDKSVLGSKKLFGRYKAQMALTYGAKKQTVNASLVFWVIPYRAIAIIVVLLVAGFFLGRFLLKRYNRHIVNKARHSSKD